MSNKFWGLFKRKGGNKENEHHTELERDIAYRRSLRSSLSKGSRRDRARFEDDISPTAPYHTVTAPKVNKGPQSCPGGYRDERDGLNRSFDPDFERERRRKKDHKDFASHHSHKYRRSARETSEYGSGDPSPLGNYSRHFDLGTDSDHEDYEYNYHDKMSQMEDACRALKLRCKEAEQNHLYYKDKYKRALRAKEDTEKAFVREMEHLKKENHRLQKQMENLMKSTHMMQPSFNSAAFPFQPLPNRMSMLHPPVLSAPSTTTTPVTSAIGSISGAGEALTEPNDISLNPYEMSSFSRSINDDKDEIKNFRQHDHSSFLSVETPRFSHNVSISSVDDRTATVMLRESSLETIKSPTRDEGYSTTTTERERPTLQRSISVDHVPSLVTKQTTL